MSLAEGTLITLANGSSICIDKLKAGDKVLSFDFNSMQHVEDEVVSCIENAEKHDTKDVWTFNDGTTLETACPHQIYNVEFKRFCNMQDFRNGDHVMKHKKICVALAGHKSLREHVKHFNLETKDYGCIYANEILAKNKPAY